MKVEPGGYWPSRARSYPAAFGPPLATATTSPVLGLIATSAAGLVAAPSAFSAASCTEGSRVVVTSLPAVAGAFSTTVVPALTTRPGVPASRAS